MGRLCPLPRQICDFGSQYDEFWCILGGIFLQFSYLFVNWQLDISLTRTAQIYSQLHFCVEMDTKKPCMVVRPRCSVNQKVMLHLVESSFLLSVLSLFWITQLAYHASFEEISLATSAPPHSLQTRFLLSSVLH